MVNISSKQQLWQSRTAKCQSSSMSAKRWCHENQVAYSTYLYWARKMRAEAEPEPKVLLEDPVFAQLPSERDILNLPQRMKVLVSMFLGTVQIEISSNCPQNLLQSLVDILNRYA